MKRVSEFEVVDLGIEYPDYFQGFGCAFTSFDNCAYGIGENPAEALDDCLETVAQLDVDVEDLEKRIREREGEFPVSPVAQEGAHYHIGIRWRQARASNRGNLCDRSTYASKWPHRPLWTIAGPWTIGP